MNVINIQTHNYINRKHPIFNSHPDLKILKSNYPEQYKRSCWFRHGLLTFAADDYIKVIKCLESVDWSSKKRMLIAGIGDSQEPFSHLAVIKNITKKPLKESLDLHIIDLQDKPSGIKLYMQSFYDRKRAPLYAKESFIETQKFRKIFGFNPKYRADDEIFEYIKSTYNNPDKSKWETPVQQALQNYSEQSFDIISINNVFCYVKSELVQPLINNIDRILKPNGVVITDPSKSVCDTFLGTKNFEQLDFGIFRKNIIKQQ